MHISDIETVIKSLQNSQNAFSDILEMDDDYLALQKLPSQQNATRPHDIICGANLRAKLGLKYGGQAIVDARLKLDVALQQFEEALSLVGNPDDTVDAEIEPNHEKTKSSRFEKSICQKAAENAAALAMKFSKLTSLTNEDNTSLHATARIDMQHIIDPSDEFSNSYTLPICYEKTVENKSLQLSDRHECDETPCYQIQGNSFSLSGAVAASIIIMAAMVIVGVAYSQPALAAKYFLQ